MMKSKEQDNDDNEIISETETEKPSSLERVSKEIIAQFSNERSLRLIKLGAVSVIYKCSFTARDL
jgi:hypothetical protein